MNSQKINCQEQVHQQSYGLVSDFDFDFTDCSNQFLGSTHQHRNQMGTVNYIQQPASDVKSSTGAVMSRLRSTDHFMGFDSHFADITANPTSSQVSRTCDSQLFPPYQPLEGTFSIGSAAQSENSFDSRSTLQSIVKSHDSCANQYFGSSEKFSKLPRIYDSRNKTLGGNDVSVARYFLSSYIEEQDQRVLPGSYSSPFGQLGQEKQCPRFSPVDDNKVAGCVSTGAVVSSKTRIRWTQELHEKFVECVNCLGGAEKATPKAILKLMDSDGLTIFHVKSHLQKYRTAKYVPDHAEGRSDKRTNMNSMPQLGEKNSGLQIKEALQLQLDVQRQLHEQLEIQRNLQRRIEEQGRQLRMMFDKQQQTNNSHLQLRIEEQGRQLGMMFDKQQQTNNSSREEEFSVAERRF